MAVASTSCAQGDPAPPDISQEALRLFANGQKQEAIDALERLVRDKPEHAGAWLDLALLRCEMGHAEEAERLFAELAARFQPPSNIQKVIGQQLAKGCTKVQPPAERLSLMLGRGFDDNVNQGASTPYFFLGNGSSRIELQLLPEYLPRRDQFTFLSAEYMRNSDAYGTKGFLQFQARNNDVLARYNTAVISAGAVQPLPAGNWRVSGAAALSAFSLGGALYQKQGNLQVFASPPLPLPENLRFDLSAGVTCAAYTMQSNLNARIWETRGQLNYAAQRAQVQVMAGYSSDRASAARPGGDRHGWSAGLQGNVHVTGDVFGELGWNRQTWNSELAYSPGLIDQARNQTTDIARLGLTIPVAARQAVRIDLRQVKNKENISIFQYDNRQLLLSWLWRDL